MKIYLVRIKEDQEWKNKKMRQQKEHNDKCKYNDNILITIILNRLNTSLKGQR